MSIVGSLDAIATKIGAVAGIKRAYAVGVASDVRPIPRSIDDTPVAIVWMGAGEGGSGNYEVVLMTPTVDIWVAADDAGYANKTLARFLDPVRASFRSDMTLGGECTRSQMTGWDDPTTETVGDRSFLVLPIRAEVLIERLGTDASAGATGPAFDQGFSGDFN